MAPAMKIQVTVKMPSKVTADTTVRMACKPGESVESFKQRVCDVISVPFPEQELLLSGAALSNSASMGECGVEDGSKLEFVVKASEATLSEQLLELLPARPVSVDELESIYTLRCGASVGQALHMLGLSGTLGDFLKEKGRSQHFVVSPAGLVQSAKAAAEAQPEAERSQQEIIKGLNKIAMQATEELKLEEELFFSNHKEQRMHRLEALLFCIQDLRGIDKEIEKINSRLDVGAQKKEAEKPAKKSAGKWYKKESSKYPGRCYYVNSVTGESSWKRPADFTDAAAPPVLVPPGLSLPVAPKKATPMSLPVPEDAEMCFDDLKDLPVKVPTADRANSLSRLARDVSATVSCR